MGNPNAIQKRMKAPSDLPFFSQKSLEKTILWTGQG